MDFREATINDIPGMMSVRGSVKENVLSNPDLVKEHDYVEYLTDRGKGWVCEINGEIAGFAIADLKEHNIWALFVTPAFEHKGIGKKLHDLMLEWYFSKTSEKVWLSTAPSSRAEKFYKEAGWKAVGVHGKGEIKFEMTLDTWANSDLLGLDYTDL